MILQRLTVECIFSGKKEFLHRAGRPGHSWRSPKAQAALQGEKSSRSFSGSACLELVELPQGCLCIPAALIPSAAVLSHAFLIFPEVVKGSHTTMAWLYLLTKPYQLYICAWCILISENHPHKKDEIERFVIVLFFFLFSYHFLIYTTPISLLSSRSLIWTERFYDVELNSLSYFKSPEAECPFFFKIPSN